MILAWRLALRDLRAGGRGLWLLAICLFVGTASLAGIGSLSSSILAALSDQSRAMLGGDLELRVSQRRAIVDELATFAAAGRVAETITTRSMAQAPGAPPALVTVKASDEAWPLVGQLRLAPGALASRPHGAQVALAPALAERLHARVGGIVQVGVARLRVIGLIAEEPGALGQGFSFGPTVLMDLSALDATNTIQPGSLYESRYRLVLSPGLDPRAVGRRLVAAFPGAGWTARTPAEASDNLREVFGQLGQFLLLVGLAALAIAGIGIGSGVSAYLSAKTRLIATLKVLGTQSATIAGIFVIELALTAAVGIAAGLVVGASVPLLMAKLAGGALPVVPRLALYPAPLATAAMLSLIVTLLAALPALVRARSVPAAILLRGALAEQRGPGARVLAAMAALAALLAGVTIATAADAKIAAGFVAATAVLLAALWLLGLGIRTVLARLPAPYRPLLRLALANLHRPGAATDRLVVALGLGFALFVALAVIDSSLGSELRNAAPARAPRFFVIDLQPEDAPLFRRTLERAAPGARIESAPSLRGAIVALGRHRITDMAAPPDSWLLRGDRTVTWSAAVPPRNRIVAGRWWPNDYHGPPLVSLEAGAARALGLKVGDSITVAILGVEVPARIAALRQVDWGGLGLNFALVYSPGYIEEAPHSLLASVYAPANRDGAIAAAVAQALPSVTMVRTGDVIEQVGDLLGRAALAVRAAAGATILAGVVVLVGALAASARTRRYDTIVLKLLGARRSQLLLGQAIEFLLLATILALVAVAIGGGAGWYVVVQTLDLPFAPDAALVALILTAAIVATLAIGLIVTRAALAIPPAEALRSE